MRLVREANGFQWFDDESIPVHGLKWRAREDSNSRPSGS